MAKRKTEKGTKSKRTTVKRVSNKNGSIPAVFALILNIILPGLGSVIGGRVRVGIWQLVVLAVALVTLLFSITAFWVIWAIDWIWAVTTGIRMLKA